MHKQDISRYNLIQNGLFGFCLIIIQLKMNVHNSETALNRQDVEQPGSNRRKYRKTNAYSQKPSFQQIFTVLIFVVITTLHGVFITSAAYQIGSSILWVIVGFTYGLLILIGFDYCYLTCEDPVDDIVIKVKKNYKINQTKMCRQCNSHVQKNSYHCNRCNRCVEHFDHHCKYLNNCIGGKNYYPFLRMLIAVTIYCLSIIGQAVWVYIVDTNNPQIVIISKWGAVITLILAGIALLAVDSLLCFHFYLIFWLKTTTLDYIMNRPDSQSDKPEDSNNH